MINLTEVLERADRIEPLPSAVNQLLAVVTASEPDLGEIARIIESDPALTLLVLRVANSAVHGGMRDIATVRSALHRLGMSTVAGLVVARATRGVMSDPVPGYDLARGELFRRAVTASIAAEGVRRFSERTIPPEVVTAALLHDLGKLVLGPHLSPEVRSVLAEAVRHQDRATAEREVLGVYHEELGALVADRWRLPRTIVDAIHYQLAPREYQNTLDCNETTLALCSALHVAVFLSDRAELPASVREVTGALAEDIGPQTRDALESLELSMARCVTLVESTFSARDARLASFGGGNG